MAKARKKQLTGEAVQGDSRIPYDRTDPLVDVPTGLGGGAPPQMDPTGGQGFQGATAPTVGGLAALGGVPDNATDPGAIPGVPPQGDASGAGTTDQLTGADLAALSNPLDVPDPDEQQAAMLAQALDDPNTPPEIRQQIEQELALAARRRLGQGFGAPGVA